ncbi:NAD-dependent succinate-semialdehyde dehydrogenase [Nonomuraea sp. NPDC050790]|uniref:NAD-dependent succinate-semialdehyde dehydrogenase n=1 Tax=Nonomuraea sp. NPDC050790 TaxID=3364371 RepID=UPI0037A6A4AB
MRTELFVGGEWRAGAERFTVFDPATEEPIAEVAGAGLADGRAAVALAQAAQPAWEATPPRVRGEILRRAHELMVSRIEPLATLITRENGKTFADARAEVAYAAEFLRWYAEEAVRLQGTMQTAPGGGRRILVTRKAVGVALLVTPWNFPAAMATRKIGPALAAGCAVVLKPAGETPLTALAIGGLLAEAGVPDGVVNVLPTRRSAELVSAMLDDPRVRKLSFTGSTEVGRMLLAQAARTVVNCSMELGGNAPFIVFADADLDAALEGAMLAKMRNGGEACTAANRFLVQEPVAEEFAARLATAMSELRLGPGLAPDSQVGPLVNADTRDKVAALVESSAGTVLTGGRVPRRRGHYYEPTVLSGVEPGDAVLGEEIFGPVAPVVTFATTDEAVAMANDTEYGLVSYVYTGDLAHGLRVCERLESGMAGLNQGLVSDPAAPFGGVKQSGIGREGGHDGLLEFTESQYIAVAW